MSTKSGAGAVFNRWLQKRIPKTESVELNQRSIFVFPTKAGFYAGVLLVVMLLTAINYQNSMVYMLVFLIAVMCVLTIHLSFYNLQGLTVTRLLVEPAFAGDNLLVTFSLSSKKDKPYYGVWLSWPNESDVLANVMANEVATVQLTLTTKQRGTLIAPRILIESVYPFGLIRVWSWLDLDVKGIVYPKSIKGEPIPASISEGGDGEVNMHAGSDLFNGLRNFNRGDSLKHVAWKQFARQGELLTKEFESPRTQSNVFSLEDYGHTSIESALSHLCFDILNAEARGEFYALNLKGDCTEMKKGAEHLRMCLQKLALY
jgi:uncharacterized protein (DUF58 family)